MKPCTRAGIEVTWKCNCTCKQCFYLRNPNFHAGIDIDLDKLKADVTFAKTKGIDHIVYIGYGEPTLYPHIVELTEYCNDLGLATSIITNGTGAMKTYARLHEAGIDHFHLSTHGVGGILDESLGHPGAYIKQQGLKAWMQDNDIKYRVNTSLQHLNYRQLSDIVDNELQFGDSFYHYIMLGFLPHYEWKGHVKEVAVHPAELRPHIEAACEKVLAAGKQLTIRYHPLCHLDPKYWPYVTNARYVYYDPWEWNYSLNTVDPWDEAVALGDSVACTNPCQGCVAYNHCGGWNKVYAEEYDGAGLQPILDVPEQYKTVWGKNGGVFDLNPANSLTGTIGRG